MLSVFPGNVIMLSVKFLSVVMLNVFTINNIMLNVKFLLISMLNVCAAKCHNAECGMFLLPI